jgi:iron-sulfur cluster assembly accessory protein
VSAPSAYANKGDLDLCCSRKNKVNDVLHHHFKVSSSDQSLQGRADNRSFIPFYFSLTLTLTNLQTPAAVGRLRALLSGPKPQLIRIGVRNRGCAGLSYHLEYVEKPEKFDEVVEQDGVKVFIESKALFSIIGSEMDWKQDALRCVSSFFSF